MPCVTHRVRSLIALLGIAFTVDRASAAVVNVTVDWSAVSANTDSSPIADLSGYRIFSATYTFNRGGVFISTTQAMAEAGIAKTVVAAGTTSSVFALNTGSTYYFRNTAFDVSGNQSTFNLNSSGIAVEVSTFVAASDAIAPTVSILSPAGGATVSGTVAVSGTASDNVGVAGVQFRLDGANLGAEDVSAPFTASWNTTGVANGAHSLTAVARDAFGNTGVSAAVSVTVSNLPAGCSSMISSLPATLGTAGATYCLSGNISGASGGFTITANNVTLDGQGNTVTGSGGIAMTGRTGVVVRNIRIPGGIDINGGSNNQVLNSTFTGIQLNQTSTDTISGCVINAGSGYSAIQMIAQGAPCTDPNNAFTCDYSRTVYDSGHVITGNVMTGSGGYDVRFVRMFFIQGLLFQNNRVTFTGSTGNLLQQHYSHNCRFYDNYWSAVYGVWDPVANPTAPERYGLHIRDGSSFNEYVGNEIHTDGMYSMLLNQPGNASVPFGHDNLVRNNKIYLHDGPNNNHDAALRHMTTTGNDRFEGNLFYAYNPAQGTVLSDYNLRSARPAVYSNNTVVAERGMAFRDDSVLSYVLRNNIFFSGDSRPAAFSGNSLYDSRYNEFYGVGVSSPISYWRSCCGTQFFTPQSLFLDNGQESGSISANPSFVNALGLNFNLTALSPAIDRGDPTFAVPTGGGARIDIGAFEYQGGGAGDTTPPTVAITAPANGAALTGAVTVSGTAADNVGVSLVQVSLDGGAFASATGTGGWSRSLGALASGSHSVTARATDAAGNVSAPASVSFTVSVVVDASSPTVPSGLSARAVSSSQVDLSWTASTDAVGVAGYRIFRGGSQIATSAATSYSNTGLTPSTAYSYTVAAYDAAGNVSAQSAAVSTTTPAAPPMGAGLMAGWALNEGSGTTTADVTANSNTGALTATSWTAGRYGNALSFDGTNSFAAVNSAASLNLTGAGTLEMWVRPAAVGRWNGLLAKGNANNNNVMNYSLEIIPSNVAECTVGNGTNSQLVDSASTFAAGTFYHLACTWDGTNVRIYVNGALDRTALQTVTPAANASALYLGQFGGNSDRFSGVIDEVRVYDRALALSEIQSDMAAAIGAAPPPDATAPTVSITAPANNASLSGSVTIVGTASDNAGVSLVEVSIDSTAFTAASGTTSWSKALGTLANGAHSVSARATDSSGNRSALASIAFNIVSPADTTPPTTPSGLSGMAVSASRIDLSWTASTDAVGVTGYRIFRGGSQIATSAATSYSDTGLSESTAYTYTVAAYDAAGNVSPLSAPATVATPPLVADTTAPTVSITSPLNGSMVSKTKSIAVTATDDTAVTRVEMFVGTALLGTDTAAPYTFSWDTLRTANGSVTLTARAYDAAGNMGTSAVTVTVKNARTKIRIVTTASSASASLGIAAAGGTSGGSSTQMIFNIRVDMDFEPSFPQDPAVTASIAMPSGLKTITLTRLSGTPGRYYALLPATEFTSQDLAGLGGGAFSLAVGGQSFDAVGEPNTLDPALGGAVADALGAQVIVPAGGVSDDTRIDILPTTPDAARDEALKKGGMVLVGEGREIQFLSSGTLSQATVALPFDASRLPGGIGLKNLGIAYYNPNTQAWEPQAGAVASGSALYVSVRHFSLYAPVAFIASAAPAFSTALVYPNPAVAPVDPVIRVCPGLVDSVNVTIFNAAGQPVQSAADLVAIGNPSSGEGMGQYCYEFVWGARKASGTYYAVVHAKGGGTSGKTRIKFAVVK